VGPISQDDDELLEDAAGCTALQELVVSGGTGVTRYGLRALANGACGASLTRLVLEPVQGTHTAPAVGWFWAREAAELLAGLRQLQQLHIGLKPGAGGPCGSSSWQHQLSYGSTSSGSCMSDGSLAGAAWHRQQQVPPLHATWCMQPAPSDGSSDGALEQVLWDLQHHTGVAMELKSCSHTSTPAGSQKVLLLEGAVGRCKLLARLLVSGGV
jgi:hypothetical protein